MDDRDENEAEADERSDPVTERVRIIGAQPAGASLREDDDAGASGSSTGPGSDVVEPQLSFGETDSASSTLGDDVEPSGTGAEPHTRNGGDPLEPGSQIVRIEPAVAVPDMPHWTDPPTGQVPAVLDRRGDDPDEPDQWSAPGDTGPAWREQGHEWDDSSFDPSLLADEQTRVGALEETPVEERRPWEFDDLHATTTDRAAKADETNGGSWWDDDAEVAPAKPAVSGSTPTPTVPGGSAPAAPGGRSEPINVSADRTMSARGDSPRIDVPAVDPVPSDPGRSDPKRIPSVRGDDEAEREVASISSSPLRLGPREPALPNSGAGHGRLARPGLSGGGVNGTGSGRNIPVAIATGVGCTLIALICFQIGTVATLILATLVVTLAVAECYAGMRQSGRRAATLPGLVATVMIMVAVYAKGIAAVPLVIVLVVVTSLVWYLVGAERGSTVEGVAGTIFGFAWVGVLGAYAALMLSPSQYPHRHGIAFLFGAIVATIGADVGALAVGSWLGRHPLAPRVSPGKTWEGLIGGAAVAIALSAAVTGQVHPWTVPKAALLGVVAAVVAPIGDLCESLVKRDLGLKDMGSMLPGHGGVLDRVDALLFVLPATYYLVRVLNLG